MNALTPADLIQLAWRFYPKGPQWEEIIVPDIAMGDDLNVGEVTLRDAIFTHGWYSY